MALSSDITLDASKFNPANITKQTTALNSYLIQVMESNPRWYEVGAEKYRQMRRNNETALPQPPTIDSGINGSIPSRDAGREIPTRMFKPATGPTKGVFLHIHGGGWVLASERDQDTYLKFLADETGLAVLSVGYRLAPENPFPACSDDCVDAAEHVLGHGDELYGGGLAFIGGESAGAHLSVTTTFELLRRRDGPLPLRGLVLHFGAYELSQYLPAVHSFAKPLIIDRVIMGKYLEALLPGSSIEQRRDPRISPFWENLMGERFYGRLPPAFFSCGTEDPLLEDTTMMSVKWMSAGGEAIVKIYPGAPHGFLLFPREQCEAAGLDLDATKAFVLAKLDA